MVTPLQKCYDEISVLKEELKKRDEQIEKLIEINKNLNKNVERLLNELPKTSQRGKVAKIAENFEKNIVKPTTKPKPATRGKVAKIAENFEKNIVKPTTKPKPATRGKVAKIAENFEKNIVKPTTKPKPATRGKVAKIAENFEKARSINEIPKVEEILWSSPQIILNENDIDKKIDLVISDIMQKITSFSASGASSLVISKINTQYIDIIEYKPLKGSSYIKLPKAIKNPKMGLINIKNEDQKCFAYCLIYHLNQSKIKNNPQRVSIYKQYENTVDFTGIEFPVSIKDIPKIEKMNNISINVFGLN